MAYTPSSDFSFSADGYTPSSDFTFVSGFSPTQATITIIGQTPSIDLSVTLTPTQAQITVTGLVPSIITAFTETVIQGTLSVTGLSSSVSVGVTFQSTLETLSITGDIPTLSSGINLKSDFDIWLKDERTKRCLLVEIGYLDGTEKTTYFSNLGYMSSTGDSPASTFYPPLLAGGMAFTESIDPSSTATMSFGDIEVYNEDGSLDDWLTYVWVNRPVNVYLGDVSWNKSQFDLIFTGIIADISSKSKSSLAFKVRDKFERLNNPISELKLGSEEDYLDNDRLIPVTLGEVCNITPLLIDEANHEYQFHTGTSQLIIEVRDNGVPIEFEDLKESGKFRLVANPAGQITCSIQGDASAGGYRNSAAELIKHIAKNYGNPDTRFTDDDIDLTNFLNFQSSHDHALGIHINSRTNTLAVIKSLAESLSTQVIMSRVGRMQLHQINFPLGTPTGEIGVNDIVLDSFELKEKLAVTAAVKLAYCKNWTVQNNLETGIPDEHKKLFEKEWLSETVVNDTTATNYKLFDDPKQIDTYLLAQVDAQNEANRLLGVYDTPRFIYKFSGLPQLLQLELGQVVTLTHPRFGFSSGKSALITKLAIDWINFTIQIEVMV